MFVAPVLEDRERQDVESAKKDCKLKTIAIFTLNPSEPRLVDHTGLIANNRGSSVERTFTRQP
jgi:hypothetical protein